MKNLGPILLCCTVLAVSAHSDSGVKKAEDHDEKFKFQLTAGPGYVQKAFVEEMNALLDEGLGRQRRKGARKKGGMRKLSAATMVRLMNHDREARDRALREGFGLVKRADRAEGYKALRTVVERKDRRIFFGVLAHVMLKRGFSSTGQFFAQVVAARDEIDAEQFKHLRHGSNRTRSLMQACFRFRDRKDQDDMLDLLAETRKSFLFGHPLASSLGLATGSRFDAEDFQRRFRKLEKGMPGTEKEFAGGEAGGHPFDKSLPPLPYNGANVEKLLKRGRRVPR